MTALVDPAAYTRLADDGCPNCPAHLGPVRRVTRHTWTTKVGFAPAAAPPPGVPPIPLPTGFVWTFVWAEEGGHG